jgi:hypothetical protein
MSSVQFIAVYFHLAVTINKRKNDLRIVWCHADFCSRNNIDLAAEGHYAPSVCPKGLAESNDLLRNRVAPEWVYPRDRLQRLDKLFLALFRASTTSQISCHRSTIICFILLDCHWGIARVLESLSRVTS